MFDSGFSRSRRPLRAVAPPLLLLLAAALVALAGAALFAGGALFGFVGLLLSVPATAAIGVLTRFFIGRYKESSLYRGAGGA